MEVSCLARPKYQPPARCEGMVTCPSSVCRSGIADGGPALACMTNMSVGNALRLHWLVATGSEALNACMTTFMGVAPSQHIETFDKACISGCVDDRV